MPGALGHLDLSQILSFVSSGAFCQTRNNSEDRTGMIDTILAYLISFGIIATGVGWIVVGMNSTIAPLSEQRANVSR
jgi:hypothetical protein